MRLLIDEALQRGVGDLLRAAGHDVLHVLDAGLQGAKDRRILESARDDGRVVVTTDTDFGTLLALSGEGVPSIILLRSIDDDVDARAQAILAAVSTVPEQLEHGAIAVVEPGRIRLRDLPIRDD